MNWVRFDLYQPSAGGSPGEDEEFCYSSHRRNPLHKAIRNLQWSEVSKIIRNNPSQICSMNRHGWSSLTLAIYHVAPIDTISEMMGLLTAYQQEKILSTPVPNGSRLCLHFAARYVDSLETMKLLAESYPAALVVRSDDGVLPLERAVYYRKDPEILRFLDEATRKQQDFENLKRYNMELRRAIRMACERARQHPQKARVASGCSECLAQELYCYCKDREEMIGLFWHMLSYVGVSSIPSSWD